MDASLVWAEIDLKAIAHNVAELRRITQPESRLMAVVKANGYGHGAIEVAQCALQNGAAALGVARIEEGIRIREAGIRAPVLIFGYTLPQQAADLLEYDLEPCVYAAASARKLSATAASLGKKIRAHLKVDTGMGRLGQLPQNFQSDNSTAINTDALEETLTISGLDGLELEGICTHF
ncbi:MAG: alanine racemase, partial [Desulfobacterales bacterium]